MRHESIEHFPESSYLIHKELSRHSGWRFSPELESEFASFVRESQRTSAVALALLGLLIFAGFAAIDYYRFSAQEDSFSTWGTFFYGIVLPRGIGIAGLLAGAVLIYFRIMWHLVNMVVAGIYLLLGFVVFSTTAVYANLGMPHADAGYLLVIMAAFLPCGLIFRESLTIGAILCAIALAATISVLVGDQHQQWLSVFIILVTFALAGVSAFMRERAQREQFLLRKLLDWNADHDPSTGLLNKRAFYAAAERSISQAQREQVPMSMAVIDIDFFKAYNDLYGHPAGDEVLLKVSRVIGKCASRPLDLAVRLGGEEFGLLSYGEGAESLQMRIEQCQKSLLEIAIRHEGSTVAQFVTFSAGIAELKENEIIYNLYWRADVALYVAKEKGRAQVVRNVAIDGAPVRGVEGQEVA